MFQEGGRSAGSGFLRYGAGFWRGSTASIASMLAVVLVLAILFRIAMDLCVNYWNRSFFDALKEKRFDDLVEIGGLFFLLVLGVAAVGVVIVLARETIQVRWREWMTTKLMGRWQSGRQSGSESAGTVIENPEYRISDDIRMAIDPLVDFAIGLFTAAIGAAAFFVVLGSVGGDLDLERFGLDVSIPYYFVVGAILYGVLASCIIPLVGRPLSGAVARKNEAEARFRATMLRADAIPEYQRRGRLGEDFDRVIRAGLEVVRQHGRITWVTNGNSALIPVVPLFLAVPKFLADELTIGEVVQLSLAFTQVQVAIAWLVENYSRLAEWYASAARVMELVECFEEPEETSAGEAAPAAAPASARVV
jgi:putative ATP-binding cassette transporter